MKLSEAIRLGAMMGPQIFGHARDLDNSSCAWGAARLAAGKSPTEVAEWAWAYSLRPRCPICRTEGHVLNRMIHLNDDHRWTRERIADWVATIEPEEVHASETNGQCSLGKGPIGPSPEVETAVMKAG